MRKIPWRYVRSLRLFLSLSALLAMRGAATVLSFLITAVIAERFGTAATADSLLAVRRVTLRLCDAARSLSTNALVPFFTELANHGDPVSWTRSLLRQSLRYSAIGLVAAIVLAIYSDQFIDVLSPGFDELRREYASDMQRVFAFMLPSFFAFGVLTAAANTRGQYGLPDALQLLPRILALGALLILPPIHAAASLPWIYVIASFAAALVLPLLIPRPSTTGAGSISTVSQGPTPDANRQERRHVRSRLWALLFTQLGLLITSWLQIRYATHVGPGAITYLELSQTVMGVLPTIILRASSSIAYAESARAATDRTDDATSKLLKSLVELGLFLTLPVVIFIAVFAEEISRLLFVRGAFSADDGRQVASLIVAFSSGSIVAALQQPLNVCFLLDKGLPLGKYAAVQMLVAVLSTWMLLELFFPDYGIFAIPISFVGSGMAVVVIRLTVIRRWRHGAVLILRSMRFWKIVGLAGLLTLLAAGAERALAALPESSAAVTLAAMLSTILAGGASYFYVGYRLRIWSPAILRGKPL